jgi:hypothetical protein
MESHCRRGIPRRQLQVPLHPTTLRIVTHRHPSPHPACLGDRSAFKGCGSCKVGGTSVANDTPPPQPTPVTLKPTAIPNVEPRNATPTLHTGDLPERRPI